MAVKRRSTKNPPVFSHEFVIQNHADIVACIAMFFVAGLMFQVTSPIASLFISLHHNTTAPVARSSAEAADDQPTLYAAGIKDLGAVFFYLLITIVVHQIVQEYALDRVNRKLHLSKIKHAKFNESGQLLCFYAVSLAWAADIIVRENLLGIRALWDGYPHNEMTYMFKFFYISQLAYWLHVYPELYFQRVKAEDMPEKVRYATLYLAFVGAAYVLSFTRVALCLIVLHYAAEAMFHACRLLSYADKAHVARPLYKVRNALFVFARLASITLAVLTFWYGLPLAPAELQVLSYAEGNFNTPLFRLAALVAVGLLQAWLMWTFIIFHQKRMRENSGYFATSATASAGGKSTRKTQQEKAKARKERPKNVAKDDEDESDLTEVDQNTKKSLRQRK